MAADGKKVLYLGDDSAYFKVLAAEFKRLYPAIKLESWNENTPERIQGLIPRVLLFKPELVFVDYSKHTDDYIHLVRQLARCNTKTPFGLVGLHDYLAPPEQIKESILCGVNINHIKSAETFDAVFDAVAMLDPGKAKEHGFATGELAQEVTASHLCKLGYISRHQLHFETNLALSVGEELRLNHNWVQKKMIPSNLVKVKNTSQSLIFYNFQCAVDVGFSWVEPIVKTEGDAPDRIKELEAEHQHAVVKAQKALETWLNDNIDRSQRKHVRVLVVDRELTFFQNRERTDKYGYAIRCQPFLNNPAVELDGQRPQVIAFAMDVPREGKPQPEAPLNDMAALQNIVKVAKSTLSQEQPFIIAFNCTASSKELQTSMGYEHILAYSGEIGPEVLLKMAAVFDKKIKSAVAKSAGPGEAVFIKKSSSMSIGEIEQAITLTMISETDLAFTCSRPLPIGSVLRMNAPFVGYITVAQHQEYSKAPSYYGLINGIGELEKKELRRFVNSLFFKDHDATKLQELEAFQSMNQSKWQELIAAQKAKLEAEAKAKAEAEAKKQAEAAAQLKETSDEPKPSDS
jgi:hypothetical protein